MGTGRVDTSDHDPIDTSPEIQKTASGSQQGTTSNAEAKAKQIDRGLGNAPSSTLHQA